MEINFNLQNIFYFWRLTDIVIFHLQTKMTGIMIATMTAPKRGRPLKPTAEKASKQIGIRIPADLEPALTEFINKQRIKPSITDVLVVALQEFLQREGCYPHKS